MGAVLLVAGLAMIAWLHYSDRALDSSRQGPIPH
jgi:hypothetical protein